MRILNLRITDVGGREVEDQQGFGPCQDRCKHEDCITRRKVSRIKCANCGEKIGLTRAYMEKSVERYVHERC
jgi:hypothetical protein